MTNNHKHHDKSSHNKKYDRNNGFVEIYSWIVGFMKGIAIGSIYGFFHNNNNEVIDPEKVQEGFSYGYKESIWCCDLF